MILLNTTLGRSHPYPPQNKASKGENNQKYTTKPKKNTRLPDRKDPYMGIKVNENLFTH